MACFCSKCKPEPPPDMSTFRTATIREGWPVPAPAPDTSSYRMETIREGWPVMEPPADIRGISMVQVKQQRRAASCWSALFISAGLVLLGIVIGFIVALW